MRFPAPKPLMTGVNDPLHDCVLRRASLNGDGSWASNELPASALEMSSA